MLINNEARKHLLTLGLEILGGSRVIPDDFEFEASSGIKFAIIGQKVKLGAYSYIVSGFLCGVEVGRYCSFGGEVQVGRQGHPIDWVSTSPFTYMHSSKVIGVNHFSLGHSGEFKYTSSPTSLKKTIIEHDVWIGHGAMVMPGVKVGTGSIIAAGAVVTKDVEAYSIVGGNPAKHIRYRVESPLKERLLESEWWKYPPETICKLDPSNVNEFVDAIFELNRNSEHLDKKYNKISEVTF